jgi:methionyl-tRNA formyltransferase
MWMVREMDAGDVIACARTPITPEDTAGSLTERLAGMAAGLLLEYLPALERREAPRTPQDSALVTLAPPIRKEERIIDWTRSAEEIWRQVRALSPTPSAVTTFRDIPVKILEACPASEKFVAPEGEPGEVVESSPKVGIFIATGMGYLQILTLQLAGKRPLSAVEFLRGYRIAAGECFV